MAFEKQTKNKKSSENDEKGFGLYQLDDCMKELKNLERQKKGSDEFLAVKNNLATILQYKNLHVPKENKEFLLATMLIKKQYEDLFDSINKYKNRKHIAFSKVGKQRKGVVETIQSYAQKEFATISEAFDGVDSDKLENKTWGDIIKNSRVTKLKVNSDTQKTGANTSDVLIINEDGGKRGFFKKEERLGTAKQEILKYIEENNEIKNKKSLTKYFNKMFSNYEYTNVLSVFGEISNNLLTVPDKLKYLQNEGVPLSKLDEVNDYELCFKKLAKLNLLNNLATTNVGIAQNSVISSRNVATSRLAGLLGSDEVVAKSKLAVVENEITHEKFRGNVMEEAEGVAAGSFMRNVILGEGNLDGEPLNSIETINVHSKVLKQLVDLQTMDSIAWQVDRHLGNYHLKIKLNGSPATSCDIEAIKGIDNDLSFGTMRLSKTQTYRTKIADKKKEYEEKINNEKDENKKKELQKLSNMYDQNKFNRMIFFNDLKTGESTLPHISEDTAKNILNLDDQVIKYMFFDILSDEEIEALIERVNVIKAAIKKSKEKNKSFLLKNNKWDQTTYEELLNSSATNYVQILFGMMESLKIKVNII